jgi:flagellar basal-body rod modification protein FlgD
MSTTPISSSLTGNSPTSTTANSNLSLNGSDFIQMMLTELKNQDPMNPTDSQALLSQMSSIGQLQSADQLQSTLTSFSFQNQMSSAGNLIGKTVMGLDVSNKQTAGIVTGVVAQNNQVYLQLSNNDQIQMSNLEAVTNTAPTTAGSAVTTAAASPATAATTTPQSNTSSLIQGILGML